MYINFLRRILRKKQGKTNDHVTNYVYVGLLRKYYRITYRTVRSFLLNCYRQYTVYGSINPLKGAYIAWSKKLVRRFIGSMDRVDPDKFIGIRESVKLGLVWQTEAFECRKNSFSQIAISTNQTTLDFRNQRP